MPFIILAGIIAALSLTFMPYDLELLDDVFFLNFAVALLRTAPLSLVEWRRIIYYGDDDDYDDDDDDDDDVSYLLFLRIFIHHNMVEEKTNI